MALSMNIVQLEDHTIKKNAMQSPFHCICVFTSVLAFAAATCCVSPRVRSLRALNILREREPQGLSSRRRMLLLALLRMAVTREHKNPSRIAL